MMAGLFVLLLIVMVLIFYKKPAAAVVLTFATLVLGLVTLMHHMTTALQIRL